MAVINERPLPHPEDIIKELPLPADAAMAKAQRDAEIAKVFEGKDDRLVLVIGPCSADTEEPVIEYIHRLADLKRFRVLSERLLRFHFRCMRVLFALTQL